MAYPGRGSILQEGKASNDHHIVLCNEELFVAAKIWKWFDLRSVGVGADEYRNSYLSRELVSVAVRPAQ